MASPGKQGQRGTGRRHRAPAGRAGADNESGAAPDAVPAGRSSGQTGPVGAAQATRGGSRLGSITSWLAHLSGWSAYSVVATLVFGETAISSDSCCPVWRG